jgi:leucyl-tRNA synthetase
MPVDLYLGGPEHAVGHLLYARFWMKVLFDLGLVSHSEPFQKLVHQGMILGMDGEKMSKSRGNVINPDDVIREYGADTLRIYEMFMGPLERDKPWSTTAIEGTYRFLQRAYRLFVEDQPNGTEKFLLTQDAPTEEDLRVTHRMIKTVTEDIEAMKFNTAISEMMVFVNHFTPIKSRPAECLLPFIQCLQPFAPHMAEELWAMAGQRENISYKAWPAYKPEYARALKIEMAVQILGKTRGTVSIDPDSDQATVEALVRENESLTKYFDGKTIRKTIFVKNKIINFILG